MYMNICIYTYMYVCAHTRTHIQTHTHTHTYTHTHTHTHTGKQPHIRLGTFADTRAAERLRDTLLPQGGWTNLTFSAAAVSVVWRSGGVDSEPFQPFRVCPLGGLRVDGEEEYLGVDVFAEAERNLEDGDGLGGLGVEDGVPLGIVQVVLPSYCLDRALIEP